MKVNNFINFTQKGFMLVLAGLFVATIILIVPGAKGKTKTYYSGDAIDYKGMVIIGSTNMGKAEIFKLSGDKIIKASEMKSPVAQFAGGSDFSNIVFNEEGNKLFAYLVDGKYLYKYDLTTVERPMLVNKEKDNLWDWFMGLYKSGNRIVTIGSKGVKVWNTSLEIVDSYKLTSKDFNNIQLSDSGKYIFDINNDALQIIDAVSRQVISESDINIKNKQNNREMFVDENKKEVYVMDDKELNKFDFNGRLIKSFEHGSANGYDIVGVDGESYIYASNGLRVIKINKSNLKPIITARASSLGGANSWAMKIKLVRQGGDDKIIVFDNSNILLLDDNLRKISSIKAQEKDDGPQESLFLSADKTRAGPNSLVSLRGGGFSPNEDLTITLAGQKITTTTDGNGRFSQIITVPAVLPVRTDIKVIGVNSGLSYNLGFEIE